MNFNKFQFQFESTPKGIQFKRHTEILRSVIKHFDYHLLYI